MEQERTVRLLGTRLYVPVLRLIREIHLYPVVPSHQKTYVDQTPVVPMLTVNQALTIEQERTDQCVFVRRDTEAMG